MYSLGPCVQRRVEASRIRAQYADTCVQDYLERMRLQIAFYVILVVVMHPAEFDASWRVDIASPKRPRKKAAKRCEQQQEDSADYSS